MMTFDELEELIRDVLPSNFTIGTDKKGQIVIFTGLKQDEDGELLDIEDDLDEEDFDSDDEVDFESYDEIDKDD